MHHTKTADHIKSVQSSGQCAKNESILTIVIPHCSVSRKDLFECVQDDVLPAKIDMIDRKSSLLLCSSSLIELPVDISSEFDQVEH